MLWDISLDSPRSNTPQLQAAQEFLALVYGRSCKLCSDCPQPPLEPNPSFSAPEYSRQGKITQCLPQAVLNRIDCVARTLLTRVIHRPDRHRCAVQHQLRFSQPQKNSRTTTRARTHCSYSSSTEVRKALERYGTKQEASSQANHDRQLLEESLRQLLYYLFKDCARLPGQLQVLSMVVSRRWMRRRPLLYAPILSPVYLFYPSSICCLS